MKNIAFLFLKGLFTLFLLLGAFGCNNVSSSGNNSLADTQDTASYTADETDTNDSETSDTDADTSGDTSGDTTRDTDADTSGDTGSDTARDTGADTSGDTGGDTARDTGADTSGDTGGDTARDTGADTNGDTGGDTARDTGADTSGDTGGDTARDTGADTSDDSDSIEEDTHSDTDTVETGQDSETGNIEDTDTATDTSPDDSDVDTEPTQSGDLPYRYVQTGDIRIIRAPDMSRDMLLNVTSNGNIVISGGTVSTGDIGVDVEFDTDVQNPRLPFLQVIDPEGEPLQSFAYPQGALPEGAWVTPEDKVVWIGQFSQSMLQFGLRSAQPPEEGFFFAILDPKTGLSDLVTTVATDDSFYIDKLTGDAEGYLYTAGIKGFGDDAEPTVMRHHPMGTPMWEKSFPCGGSAAYFSDATTGPDGTLVGVGAFNGDITIGENRFETVYPENNYWYYDGFVSWQNAETGDITGSFQFAALGFNYLNDVSISVDGNYRLGGMLEGDTTLEGDLVSADPEGSSIMIEITPEGSVVWATVLDTNIGVSETQVDRMDRTHVVSRSKDAADNPTGGVYSAMLDTLDKNGKKIASIEIPAGGSGAEHIVFDKEDGIWLAGKFKGSFTTPNGEKIISEGLNGDYYLLRFELTETTL